MKLVIMSYVFLSTAALISLLICSHAPTVAAQKAETGFNYIKGDPKGPSNWGNLNQDWKTCNIGQMQSPIDINRQNVVPGKQPEAVLKLYKPARAIIKNRGHDVSVEWKEVAGSVTINGDEYVLRQCHWHSPSEHTIDGKSFDLELHMVHQTLADNRTAVFTLFYQIGQPDPFLSELVPYLKSLNDATREIDIGSIDPNMIGMDTINYYRYMGSLTTPPCSEGVMWSVDNVAKTVSLEQINSLRAVVQDESNARPVQALNGRQISLFNPKNGPSNKNILLNFLNFH